MKTATNVYKVFSAATGTEVSKHRTEEAAIKRAKKEAVNNALLCRVTRYTQSGSYRSRQDLYSSVGVVNTY